MGTVQVTTALSVGLVSPRIRFLPTTRDRIKLPPITTSWCPATRKLLQRLRHTGPVLLQSHEEDQVLQVELVKEQPLRILQVQVFRLVNPPWLIPTCNNLLLKRSTRRTSTSTRRKRKRRKRKRRKKISVIKRRGAKSRVKRYASCITSQTIHGKGGNRLLNCYF